MKETITLLPQKLIIHKETDSIAFESTILGDVSQTIIVSELDGIENETIFTCLGTIIKEFINTGNISKKEGEDIQTIYESAFFINQGNIAKVLKEIGDVNKFYNLVVDFILERIDRLKQIRTYNQFIFFLEEQYNRIKEIDNLVPGQFDKIKENQKTATAIFKALETHSTKQTKQYDLFLLTFNCYPVDDILEEIILENTLHFNETREIESNDCFVAIKSNFLKSSEYDTITDWIEPLISLTPSNSPILFDKTSSCPLQYKKYLDESGLFFCDLWLFIDLLLLKHINKRRTKF